MPDPPAEPNSAKRGTRVEVHCFSLAPDLPCSLVCIRNLKLLVDCPLDLSVLRHFLPTHPLSLSGAASQPRVKLDPRKPCPECHEVVVAGGVAFLDGQPEVGFHSAEDLRIIPWDSVDAILLSNSRAMLGLPYVTERTKFRGKVFATEPTVQFARQLMEGLTGYVRELPRATRCTAFREKSNLLPYPLNAAADVAAWTTLYTPKEVASCLEKVERVSFSQNVELFGHQVEIVPLRSGHMIGSCNWLIATARGERIACIGASTVGSSHALPMDRSNPRLERADLLLLNSLSAVPHMSPRSNVVSLLERTVETLREGGSVLFPVHSSGLLFDLLEVVSERLQEADNLSRIPMYFIASQAKPSLAYANIFSEWLTEAKQHSVYEANAPFAHEILMRDNRLKAFPSIHGEFARSYRSPCVIFCDHPSARLGPMVHFLHSLREGTKNTLIITEPDFTELRLLLAPFQPLYMLKVFHYPVDNRLTFQEANALLYELSPQRVLTPREYLESGAMDGRAGPAAGADDKLAEYSHTLLPSRPNMKLTGCSRRQVFTFYLDAPEDGVEEGGDLVEIDPSLAAEVQPISLDQGAGSLVVLNACLLSRNGKRRLVHPSRANEDGNGSGPKHLQTSRSLTRTSVAARCLVGRIEPSKLLEELATRGLADAKLEKTGEDHLVYFPFGDSLIRLSAHATHIICSDEKLRVQIREALVACLTQL